MRISQAFAGRTIRTTRFCFAWTPATPHCPSVEQLKNDFPHTQIRILIGSGRTGTNDKVSKLARLVEEASYEHLVISDSDVRVEPDYLRRLVAPLERPAGGCSHMFLYTLE